MMKIVYWALIIVGILVVLFALDRLALLMESRGWIYWRRTKRRTGASLGDAFLEIHSILEPDKRHVIEMKREEKEAEDESGEPPEPNLPSHH